MHLIQPMLEGASDRGIGPARSPRPDQMSSKRANGQAVGEERVKRPGDLPTRKFGEAALAVLKTRLPSREDVFYVFGVIALPVFFWSLIAFFNNFPSMILRLSAWDIFGVLSYDETYALIESLVVLVAWLLLAAVLPGILLRNKFLALSTSTVLISGAWMMVANYKNFSYSWELQDALYWLGLYLLSLAVPYALIQRSRRIQELLQALARRIAVLAYLYVGLGCVGALVVLIRNALPPLF
jgi:hypothetical protein